MKANVPPRGGRPAAVRRFIGLLPALAACNQLLGTDAYSVSDGNDAIASYVIRGTTWKYPAADCGRCVEKNCGPEIRNCTGDLTCDALAACLATCAPGNSPCAAACNQKVRGSAMSVQALDLQHCGHSNCLSVCGTTTQGCAAIPGGTLDACASCSCDTYNACLDDDACRPLLACLLSCNQDTACFRNCSGGVEFGSNALQAAWWTRVTTDCSGPCLGPKNTDLSCVGSVVTPGPSRGDLKIYLQMTAAAPADFSGITVNECWKLDPQCAVLASTSMASTGEAILPLHVTSQLPDAIDVYFEVSGASIPDMLVYPPLTTHSSWYTFSLEGARQLVGNGAPGFDAGVASDPSRGSVGFRVGECSSNPYAGVLQGAAGIEVVAAQADALTKSLYDDGGWAPGTQTSSSGIGALLGVPAGSVDIEARLAGTGKVIARTRLLVRPNTVTLTALQPNL